MFPWFEYNQGFLSVVALFVALVALTWEFRQARKAQADALKARAEAEAKDRQALITAQRKQQEDRVTAERDEVTSFCFTLEQTFESLLGAARVELKRLENVPATELANSGEFIKEGLKIQRAVEAILARPPADRDAVIAACRGLEPFSSWKYLEDLARPQPTIAAIKEHMTVFTDARNKLHEAREWAVGRAQQIIIEIWEDEAS
jgi:hypothetical protein